MMMLRTKKLSHITILALVVVLFAGMQFSCGTETPVEVKNEGIDIDSMPMIVDVGDALFSIPSPFQASMLINESGATYRKEMLNSYKNVSSYTTSFQMGLNLGVYGADLGYATIYEQPQDAINYFDAVEEIANSLSITSAFNAKTIEKIKSNIGNKDSLLTIVSETFRASDEYLKNNARTDISALILAGGWVESVHFIVDVAKSSKNQDVINRLGEQKNPLENLIKILTPYYEQAQYTELIDNLIDLAYEFDGVQIKYNYVKPTVNVAEKITYINSTTEVIITEDQMNIISDKIENIRNSIIGKKQS